jgi:hypothetical protein
MLSQVSASVSTSAAAKSALLDRKIEECTADLPRSVTKQLFSISKENAATIVNYIETMKTEINPAPRYRKNILLPISQMNTIGFPWLCWSCGKLGRGEPAYRGAWGSICKRCYYD